ncbi:MAG: hypothetical protein OXE96_14305 [Gemmatimonadetes bacterium]|nr:hypothetical protein [Gemmatimonadota bacterium]
MTTAMTRGPGTATPVALRSAPLPVLVAAALAGLSACSGDTSSAMSGERVSTPAAPGSGQPFLASHGAGVWMSWTEPAASGHRVAASFFDGQWSPPTTVAEGDGFFVNWADFPSINVFGDRLVAHWLWRGGQGTYDYGVRLSWSDDKGATWSPPWTPHDDGTPTEHGFVSVFRAGDGIMATWLDGRAMVEPEGPMTVRARMLPGSVPAGSSATAFASGQPGASGHVAGPEIVVDERSCECCQTDAVLAGAVPVIAFRDRAEGEVRDIHVSRLLDTGWTESKPVHRDGWVIGGCPVNGPSMAARDEQVAVAWFTAPDGEAMVNLAFSADAAASFGPPLRVDAGQPLGRVDVVLLDDESALVTWLERSGDGAAILSRRALADGSVGEARRLADTEAVRAAGFPRIARLGPDRLMLAWTDPAGGGRVRVSVLPLEDWEAPS